MTVHSHDSMCVLILQKFSDDVANSLLKKDGMHKLPKSSTNGKIIVTHKADLPNKNFKEPTRPKAEMLGAQHVKC